MSEWEESISTPNSVEQDAGWIDTDEFQDVLSSLTLLKEILNGVQTDFSRWKWAILATHSALQGACVCILTGMDGLGALRKDNTKDQWEKLYGENERGRKIDQAEIAWPESRLADFPELLTRLPNGLATILPERNPNKEYGYDLAGDLRRLHEFRNQYTHFPSTGWSIEIAGLPRMLTHALELTGRIASSNEFQRYNRFLDYPLGQLLGEITDLLVALKQE